MYLLVKQRGLCVVIDKEDYPRILMLGMFSFINVVGTVLALQYITAVQYSGMGSSAHHHPNMNTAPHLTNVIVITFSRQ